MTRKLKNNDRVTVVLRWQEHGQLSRTIVNHAGVTKFSAIDDDRSSHTYDDEGITWARGRVYEDSAEGKALLAAYALAPKEDNNVQGPTGPTGFTGGPGPVGPTGVQGLAGWTRTR